MFLRPSKFDGAFFLWFILARDEQSPKNPLRLRRVILGSDSETNMPTNLYNRNRFDSPKKIPNLRKTGAKLKISNPIPIFEKYTIKNS